MNNKGFTLIEMLVALAIFSIIITVVMNTFLHSFASQRDIIEMQAVQREGAYIMETLSREIRMSTEGPDFAVSNVFTLSFKNHDGNQVIYCRYNGTACSGLGNSFAVSTDGGANYSVMNSSEVKIDNLSFYVSKPHNQPLVTIFTTLSSVKNPNIKVTLQSSVAARIY